jgi:hypothetical protein
MTQELPPEEAQGLKGMGSLIVDVCGKPLGGGRLSTVGLVLISYDQMLFLLNI